MKSNKKALNAIDSNKNIQRIPRPIGTTEIGIQLNNIKDKEDPTYTPKKQELINHLINHYINTNYKYNDKPLTINQFANIINIDETYILTKVYNNMGNMYNNLSDKERSHILGVLNFSMGHGFLRSQQAIQHHTQLLLESQGASYKPFISSEVTKALKLQLDTLQLGTQIHNRLFPSDKGSPTINIMNQNQQNTFSIHEAQMLINQNRTDAPLLENPNAVQGLYIEHNINTMPEVNANLQTGIDNTKEGLNFSNMNRELLEEPHTDRRAKELDIDLDIDQI